MKKILVATDYSTVSLNAVNYAAELAIKLNSYLVLFHAFQAPIIISEVPVVLPNMEEMTIANSETLEKIAKQLREKYGNQLLRLSHKVSCGLAVDKICEIVKNEKAELLVVGMHGAGFLSEHLIGSTTTSLMQQADIPVLSIPENAHYKAISHIAFACDYLEIKNSLVLEPLKKLTEIFKSQLHILSVVRNATTLPTISEAIAGIKLEHAFESLNHSFHSIQNEDIIEGINNFAVKNKIDLTVMIPRKHSILENIFKEPNTKRMAFHTSLPLLTLHE